MAANVFSVHPAHPEPGVISAAAAAIAAGKLVAFPTETVYGLGTNALDSEAVRRIFVAKGRPANNPVIVHVCDLAQARELVVDWPPIAEALAERFWPGPLTLLLPRAKCIPDIVTAGGPNVGVRVPAHPVALALLRAAGLPIAAPSANPSLRVSATTAAHVRNLLGDRVDMIIDGGSTPGGIESTVLDLHSQPPRVLRPGLVSISQLQQFIPDLATAPQPAGLRSAAPLPAPGQLPRHYAPLARMECCDSSAVGDRAASIASAGLSIGLMAFSPEIQFSAAVSPLQIRRAAMPPDPARYAEALYRVLHEFDAAGVAVIVAEMPPDRPDWFAVRDRLLRAATPESE